jgi:AcrR family transcriptional regulator
MGSRRVDENLREAIVDAAEALLADGPQAVTGRAVQRAAGVSSGTFFHYFPTVDDLLLTVAVRAAERQQPNFGDPAVDGVDAVLQRLFDPERRDTVLPWLRQHAITSPPLRGALRRYDAEVAGQFVAAAREVIPAHALQAIDLEAVVEVVRALAEGFQLRVSSGTLTVDPSRFSQTAVGLVVRALIAVDE